MVAEHALSQRHGTTVLIQEHYATLRTGHRPYDGRAGRAVPGALSTPARAPGGSGRPAQHKLNPADHLRPILELADVYDAASLEQAFATARACNTY
jgi:hypothetical protein